MASHTVTQTDYETAVHTGDKMELRVWLRLLTCSTMIERVVRSRLREQFGQTLPRFDVLAQLDRSSPGLTMSELSSRLMVSNGNLTNLVDRLESEGLVSRTPLPADRRTQVVRLTSAGKRALDEIAPAHEAWIEEMLGGLERREMHELLELLGTLKRSLVAAREPEVGGDGSRDHDRSEERQPR